MHYSANSNWEWNAGDKISPTSIFDTEEQLKMEVGSSSRACKISIVILIAIAGALLTYFSAVITDTDFGEWTPMVLVFWSVLVNVVRKFIAGYQEE